MFKKLFFLFLTVFIALSFVSCGGDDDEENPTKDEYIEFDLVSITKTMKEKVWHMVSNTYSVDDWSKGECTVSFKLSVDDEVGSGTISSDGTLTLNLSTKVKTSLLSQLHLVVEGVTATPNEVNWTMPETMRSIVIYCGDDIIGKELKIGELDMTSETLEPKNNHIWSAFDRDATIAGNATNEERTYSINAKKGWNIIKEDFVAQEYKTLTDFSEDTIFYINSTKND
ncbi:hypothetical protein JXR93_00790 [bacterium]|nr:hypothetical protein [bacterium]